MSVKHWWRGTEWNKKRLYILFIFVLELVALFGAMDSGPFDLSVVRGGFQEDALVAVIGLLFLAAGVTLWHTRKEPRQVQIYSALIVIGLLVLTIAVVSQVG